MCWNVASFIRDGKYVAVPKLYFIFFFIFTFYCYKYTNTVKYKEFLVNASCLTICRPLGGTGNRKNPWERTIILCVPTIGKRDKKKINEYINKYARSSYNKNNSTLDQLFNSIGNGPIKGPNRMQRVYALHDLFCFIQSFLCIN